MTTILILLYWAASALVAFATVLPFLPFRHGFVQGAAFPRLQWCALGAIFAAVGALVLSGAERNAAVALNFASFAINAAFIAKFTFLWPRQTRRADPALGARPDARISILCANVKMSNRAYDRLIALVRDTGPDIFIAIETDDRWIAALQDVASDFPHRVEVPRDTGYGMALYSRLPLSDTEVEERVTDEVPSIRTIVTLRNGHDLRLWAVHPEPPVIDHDTRGRDSEIASVGLSARDDPLPVIVAGDLNDVAWSHSTRQFQRVAGLADPRVGRGFYSTFHASYPFARWPLDHLFHDAEFRLIDMRRGPNIGSDHFPMQFTLALDRTPAETLPEAADPEEEADVREMIETEKATKREAIGTDWEDD